MNAVFTPVTAETPVAPTYNEILFNAELIASECERVLGAGHEMTLQAGAVVINLREGHRENAYGPIVKATFCLGKLVQAGQTLAASKTRTISDDDKKYVGCITSAAREMVGHIAARI